MTRTEKYKVAREQIYKDKSEVEQLKRENKALKSCVIAIAELIDEVVDCRTDCYNSEIISGKATAIVGRFGRAYVGKSE